MPKPKVDGGTHLIDPLHVLKKVELSDGMKVGDLGCGGAGHFTFAAANLVEPKGVVYAVDILKSALQSVETRAKLVLVDNVKTIWSDLEVYKATKIDSDSLDVVLLHNSLHQSKKREEVFREALRMLKPGGKMVVVDWKESGGSFGPPKDKRISPESIKSLAQLGEMKVLDYFDAGKYHYGFVFEKSVKE